MELHVGSLVIPHTNGTLNVEGKEQVQFERGERAQLLLTMNIYDAHGSPIARLRRNEWTFDDLSRFELTANPNAVTLIDKRTGHVVVEARVGDHDQIEIGQGSFHTHRGHRLEITPGGWRIEGVPVEAEVIESGRGAIVIGSPQSI